MKEPIESKADQEATKVSGHLKRGVIFDQEALKIKLRRATIAKTKWDNRGWYICDSSGIYHLYDDGIVRHGATSPRSEGVSAFWRTRKEARMFYDGWKI